VKISSGGEKFAPLATSRDAEEGGRNRRDGERRGRQGDQRSGQQRAPVRPVPLVAETYQQWMTSQPYSIGPSESAAKYETYAADFEEKTARSFFARHQFEEWFRRRYAPRELLQQRRDTDRAARATAQELLEAVRAGEPLLWPSLDCVRTDGEAAVAGAAAGDDTRDGRTPNPKPARRAAAGALNAAHASRIANVLRIRDVPASCTDAELIAEVTMERERTISARLSAEIEKKRKEMAAAAELGLGDGLAGEVAAATAATEVSDLEAKVSFLLFTVTFYANLAHNLTRSP
jgi:hypothetical protein